MAGRSYSSGSFHASTYFWCVCFSCAEFRYALDSKYEASVSRSGRSMGNCSGDSALMFLPCLWFLAYFCRSRTERTEGRTRGGLNARWSEPKGTGAEDKGVM